MDQWFSRPLEEVMERELAARDADHQIQLRLDERLTRTRLDERSRLASQLARFRRDADNNRMMDARDAFTWQAVGILTSGRLAEWLDLERETAAGHARYIPVASAAGRRFTTAEGPELVKKFLMARGESSGALRRSMAKREAANIGRQSECARSPVVACGLAK